MIFYHLIGLIISLSVLIWGADKFIDNSSLIAKKLGLSELTIGLTIVALGTSAPEIFVGISSIINNSEEIAVGAVVGSNISNIALIFGISCLFIGFYPNKTNAKRFMPFIYSALALGIVLYDSKISFYESFLLLFIFLYFTYQTYNLRVASKDDEISFIESNLLKTTFLLLLGLACLIFGSKYFVIYAENIAISLNVPEIIIGLTIVAIGTSLPELAATISSIIKNKNDLVVGNILGSNVLNICLVIPIIGLFSDITLETSIFTRDYFAMLFLTLIFVLVALNYHKENISLGFTKILGAFFIIFYLFYLFVLAGLSYS